MKNEKKKSSVSKFLMFIGGVALTVAGFIIIPQLLEKYSNKMYQSSLKKEKIDFNSMEPKIVMHDKKERE